MIELLPDEVPRDEFVARKPLRTQLLKSHLAIAALGLAGLVIVLMLLLTLRSHTLRLTEVREPAAQASMQIITGVQQSLAGLRGWIVSGDPAFLDARESAWQEIITPSLQQLGQIRTKHDEIVGMQDLETIELCLMDLHETQWWIEDVANTPGNQPLRVFYNERVRPIGDNIVNSITNVIDLEKLHHESGRHSLLAAMADVRGFFTRCQTVLLRLLDQEGDVDTAAYQQWLQIAESQLQFLIDHQSEIDPEQRQIVNLIQGEFRAFKSLAEVLFRRGTSQPWNVARHRLNTEAVPVALEVTTLLDQLRSTNLDLMDKESKRVSSLTNFIASLLVAMTLILSVASASIANWIAKRLSAPIVELTEATVRLAEGDIDAPVQMNSKNELGILARQFNDMRIRLVNESRALREAKDVLQRKEKLLQEVFSSAPVAMLMINESGEVALTNLQAELLFRYDSQQLKGMTIDRLFSEDFRDLHRQHQQSDEPTAVHRMGGGIELSAYRQSGEMIPIEIGLTPVQTSDQIYVLCAIVDLTERKQQEYQLIQSREDALRASRAKSDFLANMSHEIRTPMNAVIGLTNLVLQTSLDELQRDYLETVSDSAESLLIVINDILDFSKIEAGKLDLESHDFALRELIGDTLKTFALKAHEKNLELSCRIASNVPDVVIGDAGRMRQVILNLVGNAIKFTPAGHVLVNVAVDILDPIPSNLVKLRVSVADTGVGIPQDKLSRIFENFEQADTSTTRKFGGTGLGLSIASRLAEAMGGQIEVESVLDEGSTFHFTAVFRRSESMTTTPWRQLIEKLQSTYLLVVDDYEMNLVILREMLETHGIHVVTACSAEHAMQQLHLSESEGKAFSMIISDFNMPGMNGYEFATTVSQSPSYFSKIPFLLLTSSGPEGSPSESTAPNISGSVRKPVKQSELCELIVRALNVREDVEIKSSVPSARRRKQTPDLNALSILLAEDSIPNQKLALAILNAAGHRTVVAENGLQAVEAATDQEFDVVLMDIQMPEMDGFEACAKIRELDAQRGQHTPIVALTAHALAGDREKCLSAGMDSYVAKPVNPKQLFRAIEIAILGEQTDETQSPRFMIDKPAEPIIGDLEIPWALLLKHVGGQPKRLQEIARNYADEIRSATAGLAQSLDPWDPSQSNQYALQIKKAIRFFRQRDAIETAEQLESFTGEDDGVAFERTFDRLEPRIDSLLNAIDQYISSISEP
ncbi:response regulator [Rhodopirellula sp. MGV]|uniref:hybrid sensor histidine kinase/response regulator n=1 Tax=Rhodopirellula sp. MGV TaxID=2023130 RepID=UPI000B970409|nr:response regulator [Rhodopirellula sp. MGV]OYP34220.1 hypothetical protein CGZ80_15660 [Rhodopirellula sp. MGV]PNY35036.1 PAS domain S-box protein [Rhodopirellula baltica]